METCGRDGRWAISGGSTIHHSLTKSLSKIFEGELDSYLDTSVSYRGYICVETNILPSLGFKCIHRCLQTTLVLTMFTKQTRLESNFKILLLVCWSWKVSWWLTLLMACTCRAHSCHTSAYEAESGGLWVWGQPGLQSQFYARLVYTVRLCTKTKGWRWRSVVEWIYSIEKAPSSILSPGKWKQKRGRTKENYFNIMAKIWN